MSVHQFADLAREILRRPARLGPVRLVAVDGPSGAGKTTFAARLAAALEAAGARVGVVHTDDLLDGWDDIVAFWPRLETNVLEPLGRGEPGAYRPYDWHAGRFGSSTVTVPVPDVLILDGVTTARAAIRPRLTASVYVTAEPDARLTRAVARDGEQVRPHLLRWADAERAHFAADGTVAGVEMVVDGSEPAEQDPSDTFVRIEPEEGRHGGG